MKKKIIVNVECKDFRFDELIYWLSFCKADFIETVSENEKTMCGYEHVDGSFSIFRWGDDN